MNVVRAWAVDKMIEAVAEWRAGGSVIPFVERVRMAEGAGVPREEIDRLLRAGPVTSATWARYSDDLSVYDLPLSICVQNRLVAERVETFGQLRQVSRRTLLHMPMMGKRGVGEVRSFLAGCGFDLQ